eukprot:46860-Heterocapsa_arctica.AAC.1
MTCHVLVEVFGTERFKALSLATCPVLVEAFMTKRAWENDPTSVFAGSDQHELHRARPYAGARPPVSGRAMSATPTPEATKRTLKGRQWFILGQNIERELYFCVSENLRPLKIPGIQEGDSLCLNKSIYDASRAWYLALCE